MFGLDLSTSSVVYTFFKGPTGSWLSSSLRGTYIGVGIIKWGVYTKAKLKQQQTPYPPAAYRCRTAGLRGSTRQYRSRNLTALTNTMFSPSPQLPDSTTQLLHNLANDVAIHDTASVQSLRVKLYNL
jgi:hypothetical protein